MSVTGTTVLPIQPLSMETVLTPPLFNSQESWRREEAQVEAMEEQVQRMEQQHSEDCGVVDLVWFPVFLAELCLYWGVHGS